MSQKSPCIFSFGRGIIEGLLTHAKKLKLKEQGQKKGKRRKEKKRKLRQKQIKRIKNAFLQE